MSTSDVLDVLNVQRSTQPALKKRAVAPLKKQAGINRELYNLLGANTPSVQLTPTLKFKDRIHAIDKPRPWKRVKFSNGARSDGMQLSHWASNPTEAYAFEKYNTELPIPELFEDDYNEFMGLAEVKEEGSMGANKDNGGERATREEGEEEAEGIEPKAEGAAGATEALLLESYGWSFEETKYLFELCKLYSLKWIIIHDRYDYPHRPQSNPPSVETLKSHFYKLSAQIISKRAAETGTIDETLQATVDILNSFDKNKEFQRKEYLIKLLSRSSAEIAEEESLVIEARKFEMSAKKMLTERLQLLKLLDSPQSASTAQFQTSQGLAQLYNALMVSDKHKKRKVEVTPAVPTVPAVKQEKSFGTDSLQLYLKAHIQSHSHEGSSSPVAQLLSRKLSLRDEALYGLSFHDKPTLGIALRSGKLHTFKPSVQAKVGTLLAELQIPAKPVMPTLAVTEKFDELTKAIGVLLDVKRLKDKLEAELRVLKRSKGDHSE